MDWDSTIKSFGVPQAVVICVAFAVLRAVAGQAIAWLGSRIDRLCSFIGPHVHEVLRLRAEKLRLEVEGLKVAGRTLVEASLAPTANNSAVLVGAANRQ